MEKMTGDIDVQKEGCGEVRKARAVCIKSMPHITRLQEVSISSGGSSPSISHILYCSLWYNGTRKLSSDISDKLLSLNSMGHKSHLCNSMACHIIPNVTVLRFTLHLGICKGGKLQVTSTRPLQRLYCYC